MEFLKFEIKDKLGILTIDNQKSLNALSLSIFQELNTVLDEILSKKEILCLIITGAGEKAFVAGADIEFMSKSNVMQAAEYSKIGNSIFSKIESLPFPVIAAVNGFALGGGCELTLACDLVVASNKAKFGQPEVSLGLTPGWAGTQRLPRIVGIRKAKEMIYTGRMIKADEALEIGLVNKVVEHEQLMESALELAAQILKNAPIAVKLSKQSINDGFDGDLYRGISLETSLFSQCFSTEDFKTGTTGFLEKRKDISFSNK